MWFLTSVIYVLVFHYWIFLRHSLLFIFFLFSDMLNLVICVSKNLVNIAALAGI